LVLSLEANGKLSYQLGLLLAGLGQKVLIFLALGMEGTVGEGFADGLPLLKKLTGTGREVMGYELLPDIVYGLGRWMEHIGLEKAVIAQLVEHKLVGREVMEGGGDRESGGLDELVNGKQEHGLGQLTLMETVFLIADGADGEDNLYVGSTGQESTDGTFQVAYNLADAEFLFCEQALGALLAVVYNLTGGLQPVDVVGTQGDEDHTGGASLGKMTLYSVTDGGWVVHRAVGIDHGLEALLHKALAYAVGKA
jgi:hypothetical protein